MTPQAEAEMLTGCDPGVRDVVALLRKAGFNTTDSGDGVSKPAECFASGEALGYPHVAAMSSARLMLDQSHSMLAVLRAAGYVAWQVQGTFTPHDGYAMLFAFLPNAQEESKHGRS